MINDFNAGMDIHLKTAAEVYKVPLDAATKEQRSAAKTVNFGVLYGMSIHGFSHALKWLLQKPKAFIDEYNKVLGKLMDWHQCVIKLAHEQGYVETVYAAGPRLM